MRGLKEVASTSSRGGFALLFGNLISLLISAAGAIIVARILTSAEYGLINIALVLPGFFNILSNWGVHRALTRYVALYRIDNEDGKVRDLVRAGLIFNFIIGSIFSLFLFIFADIFSAVLLRRPEIGGLMKISSLFVLSQCMYDTTRSLLSGLDRLEYRAAVNVFQAMVRGVCSSLLVYIGFGVPGAIIGYILSITIAAFIGIFVIYSSTGNFFISDEKISFKDSLKILIGFGIPLFFGNLIGGFISSFEGLLLSWFASNELIGNYHVASQLTSFVAIFTGSIAVTLFPTFSKLKYSKEPKKTSEAFKGSVRYPSIFLIPFISFFLVNSKSLVYVLFTEKYSNAPLFLSLLIAPSLLVGLGSLSMGSFFNSQGDTRTSLKQVLTSSITFVLISPLLFWFYGIVGLIIGIIISSLMRNLFGLIMLRRKYFISPNFLHMGRNLLGSVVSAGFAYWISSLISASTPLFHLITSATIFIVSYLFLAPMIGAIEMQDIENLDLIFRDLIIVYTLTRFLLNVEEKILRLRYRIHPPSKALVGH